MNKFIQFRSKSTAKSAPAKEPNLEISTARSISPPPSNRSNQNSIENYSFHLPKQSPSIKTSNRPQTATNDQVSSSPSSFQRNSTVRQTMPVNPQNQRHTSASTTSNNIDSNQTTPNVYMNKSFILRQQHSNLSPATSKPTQQQQQIASKSSSNQPLKSTISTQLTSASSSVTNSSGQMNRAVELRRARAQAKIEELSQRTKNQLKKPTHQIDIMSASWHSSASSTSKKDATNLRSNPRPTAKTNTAPQREDLYATRTISSAANQRSLSISPNPLGETPLRYGKAIVSNTRDEQNKRMTASTYSIEGVKKMFFYQLG
jgi:hypothetical protein